MPWCRATKDLFFQSPFELVKKNQALFGLVKNNKSKSRQSPSTPS
jgi:hypothetical protein